MDSTGALELPDIPKSLLVVGGGYIGLELGSVYAALGTKVTVVEMTDGLLPGADRDLVNILAKRIESICEAVLLNTKVVAHEGGEGRHRGRRSRAKACAADAEGADVRSRARVGRPPPELRGARASTRPRVKVDRARLHRGRRERGAPPSRRSTRSATSPASRCSRTRRRTRDASPSRRSPASAWRSSRWRSPPSSSPIRRSRGAA